MPNQDEKSSSNRSSFTVLDLNYFSLYYEDFQEAIAFYEDVFGPPENLDENGPIYGGGWAQPG